MDTKNLSWFEFKAAGTLFWTSDRDGNLWILLARRRMDSPTGRIYTYTIPTVCPDAGDDMLSAAARAGHDELGLMTNKREMNMFWSVNLENVSIALFSQHLSSMKTPKCNGMYTDASWFCMPDDFRIEDSDSLLPVELKSFADSLNERKAVGY